MKRRQFLSTLGGAAAWPLAAHAQQPALPVIGYLSSVAPNSEASLVAQFRKGLNETGYDEGRNVLIEYRWAEGHYDRLPALAAELVSRKVAVIVGSAGSVTALAAKAATSTIPIVFETGGDPVALGLVTSISRPGGNVTGVSMLSVDLDGKRIELLHELVPAATVFGVLSNAGNPLFETAARYARTAADTLGLQLHILSAKDGVEVTAAFESLARQKVQALFVSPDPSLVRWRDHILALAARQRLPAMFGRREYAVAGGLISYAASVPEAFRQMGLYVGRILGGATPGDLPVLMPIKFELVINLKTAKALGLDIPPALLARADEVIE
jgi:putative tryptophan/tyrosine transport system substrate-binding protein